MSVFGIVSLLITIFIGFWLVTANFNSQNQAEETTGASYNDMIEAARSIPGAPQE